jgi:hypothetical protein
MRHVLLAVALVTVMRRISEPTEQTDDSCFSRLGVFPAQLWYYNSGYHISLIRERSRVQFQQPQLIIKPDIISGRIIARHESNSNSVI